jgi:hypothetical protein
LQSAIVLGETPTHQKMSVPARSVVVISELAGMVLGMFFHPFPNMQRMITDMNFPPKSV